MFGIVMAFLDYRLPTKKMPFPTNLLHSEFVGLDNFQFLFTRDALTMIRNTLGYNALWILLGLALSVALAIMMSELTRKFLAKTYQTLMFFPYFLSWVVAAYFLFAFLDPTNGMIVRAQRTAGLTPIDWYIDNTSVQGAMMAISANSDAPEACIKFLNLLNTDPYVMTLLNYGVEGIHYNLNDQDEAEFTDARQLLYRLDQRRGQHHAAAAGQGTGRGLPEGVRRVLRWREEAADLRLHLRCLQGQQGNRRCGQHQGGLFPDTVHRCFR